VRSIIPALMLVIVLGHAPAFAGSFSACLQGCTGKNSSTDCCEVLPCITDPCGDYQGTLSDAQALYRACISTDIPACSSSLRPGGCKVILEGCIRPCEAQFRAMMKPARDRLVRAINDSCLVEGCRVRGTRARDLAVNACNKHCSAATTTSSTTTTLATSTTVTSTTSTTSANATVTTTTTRGPTTTIASEIDPCEKQCILRIDSLKSCYGDCNDNCQQNQDALRFCRQSCRNSLCLAIQGRCTNGANDGETGNPNADPEYLRCCNADDSCIGFGDVPCETTTTKQTTTSTSSTIVTTTLNTTTTTSGTFP
jgi:hypothetical protein